MKYQKLWQQIRTSISLILCLTMVLSLAGCKKNNDAEKESITMDDNKYDINENDYDTYIEYDEQFLSVELSYLNDNGYVESADIPAMLDEVEQYIKQGIEDGLIAYYNREDDNIFVKFSSGIPYLFIPQQEGVLRGGSGGQILTLEPVEDNLSTNYESCLANLIALVGDFP